MYIYGIGLIFIIFLNYNWHVQLHFSAPQLHWCIANWVHEFSYNMKGKASLWSSFGRVLQKKSLDTCGNTGSSVNTKAQVIVSQLKLCHSLSRLNCSLFVVFVLYYIQSLSVEHQKVVMLCFKEEKHRFTRERLEWCFLWLLP